MERLRLINLAGKLNIPIFTDVLSNIRFGHNSQNIISEDENGLKIEINVGINWELKEEIRKHGSLVKVLRPSHLVEEIKNELAKTLKQY